MDISYLLLLQDFRTATMGMLNSFFLLITKFGESYLPYILCLWFYWAFDKNLGKRLMLTLSGAVMLNGLTKLTACVYRPWIRSPQINPAGNAKVTATGYSFPSGHTTQSTASYGVLAFHYRKKKVLSVLLAVLLLLVMFSRNYLGVHTPQDVIVGFTETALAAWLMSIILKKIDASGNGRADLVLVIVSVLLVAAEFYYFLHKGYPLDYGADGKLIVDPKAMMPDSFSGCGCYLGTLFGWYFERKTVRFSTDHLSAQVIMQRCLSGVILYLVMMNIIYPLVLSVFGSLWGAFIGATVIFFYLMGIHPYLFRFFEKEEANAAG